MPTSPPILLFLSDKITGIWYLAWPVHGWGLNLGVCEYWASTSPSPWMPWSCSDFWYVNSARDVLKNQHCVLQIPETPALHPSLDVPVCNQCSVGISWMNNCSLAYFQKEHNDTLPKFIPKSNSQEKRFNASTELWSYCQVHCMDGRTMSQVSHQAAGVGPGLVEWARFHIKYPFPSVTHHTKCHDRETCLVFGSN